MAPKVCRKTSEDHFFGGHTTKTVGKSCTTTFGQDWENLGKNPLHPQKCACSHTYVCPYLGEENSDMGHITV